MSGSEQNDEDSLVKKLSDFEVDANGDVDDDVVDWKPEHDYYVHIDVLKGLTYNVATAINQYMIQGDAYDPRRICNFPTDLLEERDRNKLNCRWHKLEINTMSFGKYTKNFHSLGLENW